MDSELQRRSGDPLAAMYVLAAVAMCLGALFVTVMMFVPRDGDARPNAEAYVPGSVPGFRPLGDPAARFEEPGVTEVDRGRYVAVINAYNWNFQPSEIRVPVGAEVTFRGRAINDYHGIAILGTDVVLSFTQQQAAVVTHVFDTPGEYPFICSEYCGAGHADMTGRIVVYE